MNKYIVQSHTSKLANYFKNLLIVLLVFEIMCALSFVGFVIYVVALAIITLLSVCTLLLNDTFRSLWQNLDKFSGFADKLTALIPAVNIISIAVCIAAIATSCFNLYFCKNRSTFYFAIVNIILQIILCVAINIF